MFFYILILYSLSNTQLRDFINCAIILYSLVGAISLKAQVDYEQFTEFVFEVLASDTTAGSERTGTTVVTVIVVDNNENPPIFDPFIVTPISENIAADVLVVQV